MNAKKTLFYQSPLILSTLLLLALGFIWGSGYSLARFVIQNGVSPLGYAFWQSIGPAIFTGFLCYFTKTNLSLSPAYIRYYFICGLLGIAIPNTNIYICAKHLPAGILAILANTVPIITYMLALVLQEEHFIFKRFLGVFLGILGIMSITILTVGLPQGDFSGWAILMLVTPLSFSACAIYATRKRPEGSHTLAVSTGMLISSSILLIPIVFITDNFYPLLFPFSLADWMILLEILLSSIGYILLFQLLKLSGAVHYSLVGGIVSVTGLFWGWLIFKETISLPLIASVMLILMGIFFVTIGIKTCQHKKA